MTGVEDRMLEDRVLEDRVLENKEYEKKRAILVFLLAPLFLLAGLTALFGVILLSDPDVAKAYPNPEMHRGVARFHPPSSSTKSLPGREKQHDFDGDGVPDRLSLEYFNMEPLFRPATSGMVYVHSGATGAVLLAHAVPTPIDFPKWYGDFDGNGTMDVLVRDNKKPHGAVVLGRP